MNLLLSLLLLFIMGKDERPASQAKPLFSFGVIADVQYADAETSGSRYYRSSAERLREACESFRNDSVSFIINLGDLIDRDYSSYSPIIDILNSSGIKTFHVSGNHDYAVDEKLRKKIPVLDRHREGYYSFSFEGYRFIVLNGNEISTYSGGGRKVVSMAEEYIKSLRAEGEPNAMEWNGAISKEQLAWLGKQLDESISKGEKVFILCHFPVFPVNAHNLFNYKEVNELLKNYSNIIAWFAGHNHAGNYGNLNLIHFVTFRGMVETPNNSYAVVDVYKNKLWINGYGRERSLILEY